MNKKIKKSAVYNRLSFIALPIVFALLSFLLLYVAFKPVVLPAVAAAKMMIGSQNTSNIDNRNLMELESIKAQENIGNTIPLSSIIMPQEGDQYAKITVTGTAIDAPVFWGDRHEEMNQGVGTYTGAWLPGFGKTVMMVAHTGTWFSDMQSVEIGSTITVETHYGTYTYEVVDMQVKLADDPTAYDFSREDENIILYTCYPFQYIGLTDERYFVYGDLIEGAVVDTEA